MLFAPRRQAHKIWFFLSDCDSKDLCLEHKQHPVLIVLFVAAEFWSTEKLHEEIYQWEEFLIRAANFSRLEGWRRSELGNSRWPSWFEILASWHKLLRFRGRVSEVRLSNYLQSQTFGHLTLCSVQWIHPWRYRHRLRCGAEYQKQLGVR